jgi:toxin-antitoxin system PIN domain toxin
VIAPDANLLIYAYQPGSPFHAASREWLEHTISSGESLGIPILSVHAFLRFMTNAKIHPSPATFRQAAAIVDSWLKFANVRLLYPGERHWELMQELAAPLRLTSAQLTDAALAAIAIEYGAVIHTHDRDFARFTGLRWFDPLA